MKKAIKKILGITELEEGLKGMEEAYAKERITRSYEERLTELEVKMAKLWGVLMETTPRNKERLSRFGKLFGGRAREQLKG